MPAYRSASRRAAAAAVLALTVFAVLPAAAAEPGDEVEPRIVGGWEVAPPDAYPFMVALVRSSDTDAYQGQFCGGSLIGPSWVLTAAHCVYRATPALIDVVIGRHDLTTSDGERIGVTRIVVHPDYDHGTSENDVAVLELDGPSSYTPIELAADGSLDAAGTPATVTGWGDTRSTPRFPTELHEVDVALISDSLCTAAYVDYSRQFSPASMLCAGDLVDGGEDACQGDSGGPLFTDGPNGPVQLGIVSWGKGCAEPDYPGVYSRVSALQEWIAANVELEPAPLCRGEAATIWGTSGDDVLRGTAGPDVIVGLRGDDDIDGLGGDDLICAGPGNDTVRAGDGGDVVYGGGGNDLLFGGWGDDRIVGGLGGDTASGGLGDDHLQGRLGDDALAGDQGRDELRGGPGNDVLDGGGADDLLYGGGGDDQLTGGWGTDRGNGGAGVDSCVVEAPSRCE